MFIQLKPCGVVFLPRHHYGERAVFFSENESKQGISLSIQKNLKIKRLIWVAPFSTV